MPVLSDSVTAAFSVRTVSDPQAVLRLLGLLAQQDLVPSCVEARRVEDCLLVRIQQPAISEHRASIIAEKMRSLVLVESVALECEVRARNGGIAEGASRLTRGST